MPAEAVGDDPVLVERRPERGAQAVRGQERVVSRFTSRPAGTLALSGMCPRRARLPSSPLNSLGGRPPDQRGARGSREDVLDIRLAHPQFGAFVRDEGLRARLEVADLRVPSLGQPLGVAAVEHRDRVVAEAGGTATTAGPPTGRSRRRRRRPWCRCPIPTEPTAAANASALWWVKGSFASVSENSSLRSAKIAPGMWPPTRYCSWATQEPGPALRRRVGQHGGVEDDELVAAEVVGEPLG